MLDAKLEESSCKTNENTKIIYDETFCNRRNITCVVISNSVMSIGDSVFYNSGDTQLIYNRTKKQWENVSRGNLAGKFTKVLCTDGKVEI